MKNFIFFGMIGVLTIAKASKDRVFVKSFINFHQPRRLSSDSGQQVKPYFEHNNTVTNLTVHVGSTVFLNCRVINLKDRTVSWVKKVGDDLQLLTVGLDTHIMDERYSLKFDPPGNWKLQIKFAQVKDAGSYKCQVSSHPPMFLSVYLDVVVPKLEIVDERNKSIQEKYYKIGSTLQLKCIVKGVPQLSNYVTWRHQSRILNYEESRKEIRVNTENVGDGTISELYISNAQRRDSGDYSCSVMDIARINVMVHVLHYEHPPAAVQRGSSLTPPFVILVSFVLYQGAQRR